VSFPGAHTTPRLRVAVAVLAAVWMAATTAQSALPWADTAVSHHPHAFASSHDSGSALLSDHPHLGVGSVPSPPDLLTAVLPTRAGTGVAALGLAAALIAVAALGFRAFIAPVRGPPIGISSPATGQHILTRFCIARR